MAETTTPTQAAGPQRCVIVIRERRDAGSKTNITAVHLGPQLDKLLKDANLKLEMVTVEELNGGSLCSLKIEGANTLNAQEKETICTGVGLVPGKMPEGKALLGQLEHMDGFKATASTGGSKGPKKIALRD